MDSENSARMRLKFMMRGGENKYRAIAFICCIILTLIFEWFYRDASWEYDARDYWERGVLIYENHFQLESIDGFRGYIYPFYLAIIRCIGGRRAWFFINAFVLSGYIVWVLPGIQKLTIGKKLIDVLKTVILALTISVFLMGGIVYPLSDVFAIILVSIAVLLGKKSIETASKVKSYLCAFLMGIFCYLAYNTRTIFLFAGMVLGIVYIYRYLKCKSYHEGILCVFKCLTACAGVLIAAVPQIYMNYMNLGIKSMAVPTDGLMQSQLFWGLQYQRYDTYINCGTDKMHTSPAMFFADNVGQQIMNDSHSTQTFADYFKLVIRHPIDVFLIYVRHAINYLFPAWPEVYVHDLNKCKWVLGIIAFTFFFIVTSAFLFKCLRKTADLLFYVPILTPAVLIIPGAVEYRFSYPIYICLFCQLFLNIDYRKYIRYIWDKKMTVLVTYIVTLTLTFVTWANMLASETVTPLFFN